jgi:hypothetical protein
MIPLSEVFVVKFIDTQREWLPRMEVGVGWVYYVMDTEFQFCKIEFWRWIVVVMVVMVAQYILLRTTELYP